MPRTTTAAERDPIDRHLLGRRAEGRIPVQRAVECQGARGRHPGELLNLSRSGALFTLLEPRFQMTDESDLVETGRALDAEFGHRLTVRFEPRGIVLNARLVRAARDGRTGRTVVACAFDRPLSVRECRLLGLGTTARNEVP